MYLNLRLFYCIYIDQRLDKEVRAVKRKTFSSFQIRQIIIEIYLINSRK
jgi:hypothetical protein